MSNLMHENFLSNKENLNGFDDTMDEPMEIDPSTPFANKIRQVIRPPQESNQTEATNGDTGLKEQQSTNGPKIVKSGPKIVKPVVIAPKVVRPNGGLPAPQINDTDFDNVDPFKTKSKIEFDATEFQSPGGYDLRLSDETANETNAGGFNLRLSDETINETNAGGFHLRLDETNNCSMVDNQVDPFKTKSSIMNSPPRQQSPAKSNLFKSPPPPPIFSNDNLNSNIDELTTSSEVSSQQNTEGMNDEWETHQKRSSTKQSTSALSSNTDLSSSENVLSSPPASGNKLGLSTSPSTESHSESTSIYSSNTASTSSINNKQSEGGIENEQSEELASEPASVWTAPKEKSPSKEPTPAPEVQAEPQAETNMETTPTPAPDAETTAEPTTTNQDIHDEVMNQLNSFKANNFVTSSRGEAATTSGPTTGNLLDFGDFDNKLPEANIADKTEANEEDKSTVDNVVFDSIFSSDTDFNSFLDLLEKKEVDNSVKNSPKYSEFARKSLYLQFDPITQLNLASQLSPEKVKRLSIIVDKKKAIKNYLCDIKETVVEDETETETNEPLAPAADNKTLIDVKSSEDKQQLVAVEEEQKLATTTTTTTAEKPDMIISNSNMDLIGETETFSKKLDLNDEHLNDEEACVDKIDDEERPQVRDESAEDDHISKIPPIPNETRASIERSKPSDLSFKLITDDSMMLDESQLINIKSNRLSEVTRATAPAVSTNRSSTEDLSSSSVCMSSASNHAEVSKLMAEVAELRERETTHLKRIDSLEVENEKFKTVAIDFEEIFKNLIQEKEECEVKLKNEIIELTKERDHLQEDVIGVERAFDDLHRRFEKLKTKVEEFKKNEESLTNAIDVYKQQLDKEKNKYSTLKKHAEEKIEFANTEIEKVRKGSANELQRLQAELRKAEIKISSLDLSVAQKDQENSQLTNLLEDLLQKVKP